MPPAAARQRGLTSTVTFPRQSSRRSVISTATTQRSIRRRVSQDRPGACYDGKAAIEGTVRYEAGRRAGAQPRARSARHGRDLSNHRRAETPEAGAHIAVLTDARFSGVSTTVYRPRQPEVGRRLIGKFATATASARDRPQQLEGSVNLIGDASDDFASSEPELQARGTEVRRPPRPDLASGPACRPTRDQALLQNASGGVWAGCVRRGENWGQVAGRAYHRTRMVLMNDPILCSDSYSPNGRQCVVDQSRKSSYPRACCRNIWNELPWAIESN